MLGNLVADDLFSREGKLQSSIVGSFPDTSGSFPTQKEIVEVKT